MWEACAIGLEPHSPASLKAWQFCRAGAVTDFSKLIARCKKSVRAIWTLARFAAKTSEEYDSSAKEPQYLS
jgi:hypothetical protein